ncbi:MAG TPA: FG-GAP-like repeat-containing protein, partial [Terriglobales bacterium]|nr:FG-GAP-like repeat-containing protein [Terriglobales bacterium]
MPVAVAQGIFRFAVTYSDSFNYNNSLQPSSVAVGDFNGDGKPDVAVANFGSNISFGDGVSVFLGNADGTFQAAVDYGSGTGPMAITAHDFNGDGKLDLAIANYSDNTVSVLLGKGDGTFQTAINYNVGLHPSSVAVGDFNKDGKPDLIVANQGDNQNSGGLSLLLANGDGTFQPAVAIATVANPVSVAVADLDGDGKQDLVIAGFGCNCLAVITGNGDATFGAQNVINLSATPKSIAVGDLNGDGRLDIVAATALSAVVLLNQGNGSFHASTQFVGGIPQSIAIGDVNSDGKPDLLVGSSVSEVSLLLGNGDGNFQAAGNYLLGLSTSPNSIAIADFNSDGRPDLVIADSSGISVLLNNVLPTVPVSNGLSFAPALNINIQSGGAYLVAVGDLNNDGKPDVAAAIYSMNNVSVSLGLGNGNVQAPISYNVGAGPASVLIADVNGDGNPDLITANFTDNNVSVLLGNGNGTFKAAANYSAGVNPTFAAIGDFNGDGKVDLAVANGTGNNVSILLGNGDGSFQPAINYSAGARPLAVATTDLNGDGKLDLVVVNEVDNNVSVLLGNGDGTFQAATNYGADSAPGAVAIADFNADGKPDLVVSNRLSDDVSILLGRGDGTFQPAVNYSAGFTPESVAVADFNGDGKPDLVVADLYNSHLGGVGGNITSILLGRGDGSFQPPIAYNVAPDSAPFSVSVGDLNRDEKPDVVVGNGVTGFSVLLNSGGTNFTVADFGSTVFGQPVLLQANVAATLGSNTPSGSLQFQNGGANLGAPIPLSGSGGTAGATLLTTLPVGTHTITALYSGDAHFWTNTSVPVIHRVDPANTAVLAFSSNNLIPYGNPVILQANVTVLPPGAGTPEGFVLFQDSGTNVGSPVPLVAGIAHLTIDGTTVPFLSAGTHKITAIFSPIGNFAGSVSPPIVQNVGFAATATAVSSLNNPASFGRAITLQVNVVVLPPSGGIPDGLVQFQDDFGGGQNLGLPVALSAGVAQLTMDGVLPLRPFLAVGTHHITATYYGTGTFKPSSSGAVTQVVNPGPPPIAWNTPTPITYGTALSATQLNATSNVPGTFVYNPAAGTILPAGSQTLSVTFTPTDTINYTTATATVPLIVTQAPLTITASNALRAYGQDNPALTGIVGATQNGDVITATYSTTANPASPVGTYTIIPTPAGAALSNYSVILVNGRLLVNPASLNITALNASRPYGSPNPVLNAFIDGVANNDNITVTGSSSASPASAVGTYPIVPVLSDPDNRLVNYRVSSTNGVLTVAPALLTVTANNASRPFGIPNPAFTGSLVGVVNSDNITAVFTSAATPASPPGTYAIVPALIDPGGLLSNYSVTNTSGALTVTQAVTTMHLTALPNPADYKEQVTFIAHVSSVSGLPAGTVSFFDGGKLLDVETMNATGTATIRRSSLGVGTHKIKAIYGGNGNFHGSSATLSEII